MLSRELAAHKEMVTELRKQLAEKENELQVFTRHKSLHTHHTHEVAQVSLEKVTVLDELLHSSQKCITCIYVYKWAAVKKPLY